MTEQAAGEDGRYVAFTATSDGLVDDDDDRVANVYRKDMETGDVVLVSRRDGVVGEAAHEDCRDAAISDDGRRVAFVCSGPLDAADTNGQDDVYVRDIAGADTTLASRVPATGAAGDNRSFAPALDDDGSVVVFVSTSTNLSTNAPAPPRAAVYRHDLLAGGTVLVSRRDGALGALAGGGDPSVTDDGAVVAFSTNEALDPALDANGGTDVYVREVLTGRTTLVSRASGPAGAAGNGSSRAARISGNGLAVVFESTATNLDARDGDDSVNIYRRGLGSSTTAMVDLTAAGVHGRSWNPSVDDSGHVIAFVSDATVHDPADKDPTPDAYVANVLARTVEVASRADGPGGAVTGRAAVGAAISGDAYHVVASLDGGAITPDADTRRDTIVRRSLASGTTRSVARPGGQEPFVNTGGEAGDAVLSADGRYAAFRSEASGLGLPAHASRGVFLRDRVTGAVTLVSRAHGQDGEVFADASAPAISADGRRVAFAAPLDPGGPRQVWVREPATGRTWLASLSGPYKGQVGDGRSGSVSLDGDGTRVAFRTRAKNLTPDDTDTLDDVLVRDLETGQTILVSRADGAAGAKGDGPSRGPDLDASGTRVSFVSTAKNLVDGDDDTLRDAFVRDLVAGTTRLVSATPAGVKADQETGDTTSIDASGSRVAFDSTADNLGAASPYDQVFVRDFTADRLDAVGVGHGAKLSPEGDFVAFTGYYGAALLRSLRGGGAVVVSRHAVEEPVGTRPDAKVTDVSAAGGCVTFETLDPIVGPRRDHGDAYLRALLPDCGDAPAAGPDPGPAGGDGGPARPGTPDGGGAQPGSAPRGPPPARAHVTPWLRCCRASASPPAGCAAAEPRRCASRRRRPAR
jgi:Tol biopolymer transport system component